MLKPITVQCQKCGTLSEAWIETTTNIFELYPNCACEGCFHDQVIGIPPKVIIKGNEGTARENRGRGQWGGR